MIKKRRGFRDYEFSLVPKEGGGAKRVLVYIGDLYTAQWDEGTRRRDRILFTAASLLCGLLQVVSACAPLPSNVAPATGAPAALALGPIFFMIFGSLNEWTVTGPMEQGKYRATACFRRYGAFYTAAFMVYCIVSVFVFVMTGQAGNAVLGEILLLIGYGVVLILSLAVYRTEKRIVYHITPRQADDSEAAEEDASAGR